MAEFLAESGLKAELSRGLALLASLYKISIYIAKLYTDIAIDTLKRSLKLERYRLQKSRSHAQNVRAPHVTPA
eukprot:g2049.t1